MEKMELQKNEQKKIFTTKRLNKPIYVVDIETDGLLDEVTKIHCLSYGQMIKDQFYIRTLTNYEEIKNFVSRKDITIVGHNFISYDNLILEKLLGIKFELSQLIDSLYVSWALYPKLLKHGLEEWGNTLGVKKPYIADWKNPTTEEIKFRCESDVKINLLLWTKQFKYLTEIYEGSFEHYLDFLMLIADIVVYQELNPCRYDVRAANILLEKMEIEKEQRITNLKKVMPNVQKKTTKIIKNVVKISDEEFYQKGDLMYEHYLRLNYPIVDHKIVKITGEEPPNPNSVSQKKAWLYSLGWVPTTFKKVKEKDGSKRPVEQIMSEEGDGSLCTSVQALFEVEPGLKELEGLSILTHRIGVVKGLNRDQRNGYIQASISGLTQTLRLKHKYCVNMPKPSKAYGKEIRGLIIAEEGGLLIGTDLANIESRTKNHFIYDYDPDYVEEMSNPLFDSHLDTAYQGGLITKEDLLFYTWYNLSDKSKYDTSLIKDYITLSEDLQKKEINRIKNQRQIGKGVNFSCLPIDNTEVLTETGWMYYSDLFVGQNIFTYNRTKDELELKPITKLISKKDKTINLFNKYWNFESTADHRWWGQQRHTPKKKPRYFENIFKTTSEINSEFNILNVAKFNNKESIFTDAECSILACILYLKWSNKKDVTSSSFGYKKGVCSGITQKKYHKEIKELLDNYGFRYKDYYREKTGMHIFHLNSEDLRNFAKKFGFFKINKLDIDVEQIVLKMSYSNRDSFIKWFKLTDGGIVKNSNKYYQNNGNILEGLKLALTLNGLNYKISSNGKYKKYTNYTLTQNTLRYTTSQRLLKKENRETNVFCLTNDNETFIIRQNGVSTITGNCQYGAGPATIAEQNKIPLKIAKKLHKAYHDRNKSVQQFANSLSVKTVQGQKWIFNPIFNMWYFLKADKDKFSAVNQGTASAIFMLWIKNCRDLDVYCRFNVHDEQIIYLKENEVEETKNKIKKAIDKVNDLLQLNVKIDCSMDVGINYAQVH